MGDTADHYTDFGDYDFLWDGVKKTTNGMDTFWVLWQPGHPNPPRVKFSSEEEAERVAGIMVRKHGGVYYVLQAKTKLKKLTPVEKTVLK